MISDSFESSTKIPIRHNKNNSLICHSFVSTAGKERHQGGFLAVFDTIRARHSHSLYWLPRCFSRTYLHPVVKSHQVSFSAGLPSSPLSGSFHQRILSPAQQVNPARGSKGGRRQERLQWSLSAELKWETRVPTTCLLLKRAFVASRKGRSFRFHFPQTTDLSDSVKVSLKSAAITNRNASCQSYLLQEKCSQT